MTITEHSLVARRAALGIAALAAVTLITRVFLRVDKDGSVIGALSHLSQFFTILTNAVVMVVMTMMLMLMTMILVMMRMVMMTIVGAKRVNLMRNDDDHGQDKDDKMMRNGDDGDGDDARGHGHGGEGDWEK